MSDRKKSPKRHGWILAPLLLALSFNAGCSKSDTGAKSDGGAEAAKAPAAAPAPAANAAAPPAVNERKGGRNDKMAEAIEKAKKAAAPKPVAPATALSSEDPTKWNGNDLKLALAKKDPRYNSAVAMRGAGSRGDAAAGAELSQLLDTVAKLPADGSGGLNMVIGAAKKKKKSSRRGDDDEPATATAPAAAPPAGAVPNAPPAAAGPVPGPTLKLNIGQNRER